MGKATLSDGSKTFIFPLAPETIEQNFNGEYAASPVLDLANPIIRRKASNTVTKLTRCLFISNGLNVDQYPLLNTLQFWARAQTVLSFNYNKVVIPICYIKSMTVDIKQYRNGDPVHIELDIDLLAGTKETKATKVIPAKKITPREQAKKKADIKSKLKTPAKKTALGIAGNFDILVSDVSQVTITNEGTDTVYDYDELIEQIG